MPAGKNFDFEFSNNRGVSVAEAQITITRAEIFSFALEPARANSTPSGVRCPSTVISRTKACGITRQRPVLMASGITVTSVDDFAPTSHPNPLQKAQRTQAERPRYGC